MNRRAVPARILLLILALAGFVAGPLLDVCHRPGGHHGHGHAEAAAATHGDRHTTIAMVGHAEAPSPAPGDGDAPIAHHHDDHFACFTATLQPRPEFLVDGMRALDALASPIGPSLPAFGPATPPP